MAPGHILWDRIGAQGDIHEALDVFDSPATAERIYQYWKNRRGVYHMRLKLGHYKETLRWMEKHGMVERVGKERWKLTGKTAMYADGETRVMVTGSDVMRL